MTVKVGFVTIGQSPRADVVPEIARILGPQVRILENGALDKLSGGEIKNLRPEKGDFGLITRLRDGRAAVVGKKKILPLLEEKIDELAEQNVRLIALLCTDEFPSIGRESGSCKIVLQPSRLLRDEAVGRLKEGKLGVFVPLDVQMEAIRRKWKKTGLRVVIEALNPYQETGKNEEAFESMRKAKPNLIVLDCIGYTQKTKDQIQRLLGKTVLLPRFILASEMLKLISD